MFIPALRYKMLLAIDVGNTNITFAVFDGDQLRSNWRIATVARRTGDEYAALLLILFGEEGLKFADINGVAISSVVPATVDALVRFSKRHLKVADPLVLKSDTDLGIKVNYNPVTDVGADRIANALAAQAKYGGSCVVVDFGTAVTVDAISEDGVYLGGAIAPGIQISLDALFARAARLRSVELIAPPSVIGDTTSASLQSGIIYGYTGMVDALVERFLEEMNGNARVIATGGHAEIIAPHSRTIETTDEMLTLDGLRIIHQRISK